MGSHKFYTNLSQEQQDFLNRSDLEEEDYEEFKKVFGLEKSSRGQRISLSNSIIEYCDQMMRRNNKRNWLELGRKAMKLIDSIL